MLFSVILSAQDVIESCGDYTYYAPENIALEQAKQTALKRAKLDAIEKKFGTNIRGDKKLTTEEKNGQSDEYYFSLIESEEKGEWIEDIGKPYFFPVTHEQNMQIVRCTICGKIREIFSAGIDFSVKVLNNPDSKYETENFHDGENFFLKFRSPVNGFLAVYLIDYNDTAYCLLPYSKDNAGKVKAQANKDYIFFSEKHAEKDEKQFVKEYSLYCEKSLENNTIYIIFSPNEFTKASDAMGREDKIGTFPRNLSNTDFQKWLSKNKLRDKDMKVEIKSITIKK